MTAAEMQLVINARDNASAVLRSLQGVLGNTAKAVEENKGAFSRLGDAAKKLALPIAAAGAVFGAFAFKVISTTADIGGEIAKLKREFGGTAEEASKLRFQFQQTGISFEKGELGVAKFAKALAGVTDLEDGVAIPAGKAMVELLRSIGVEGNNAAGGIRPMSEVLGDVAERFKTLPDGAQKTALATQLFGRSGRDLIPFLNRGRDGLKELGDQAQRLGLVLDQKTLNAISKNKAGMREFRAAMEGVQLQLGLLLLPAVTALMRALSTLAVTLNTRGIPVLKSLGRVVGPELLRGFALTVAGIKAVVEAVRDIPLAVTLVLVRLRNAIDDLIGESNPLNVFATRLAMALGVPRGSQELIGFTSTLGALFRELADHAASFIERFAPVTDAVSKASGAMKILRDVMDVAAFAAFATVIGSVAASLLSFPLGIVFDAAKGVADLVGALAGLVSKTVSVAVKVAQTGFEILQQILSLPGEIIQTVTQKVFRSPLDEAKLNPKPTTQVVTQTVAVTPTAKVDGRKFGLGIGGDVASGIIGGLVGRLQAMALTRAIGAALGPGIASVAFAEGVAVMFAAVLAPLLVAALVFKFRSSIGAFFRELGESLAQAGKTGATAFANATVEGLKNLPNVLGGIAALAVASVVIAFLLLPALVIRTIVNGIKAGAPALAAIGSEIGQLIAGGVVAVAAGIAQALAGAFRAAVSLSMDVIGTLFSKDFWQQLVPNIRAGLGNVKDVLVDAFLGAPEAIADLWNALPGLIGDAIGGLIGVVTGVLSGVAGVFKFVFTALVAIVDNPLAAIIGLITDFGGRVAEGFRDTWAKVNEATGGELNKTLDSVRNIILLIIGVFQSLAGAITDAVNIALRPLDWLTDRAWQVRDAFWAARDGVHDFIQAIKDIPGDIIGGAIDLLPGPRPNFPGFASGLYRVPLAAMPVMVHQDEAILNKTDADTWRAARRGGSQFDGSVRPIINIDQLIITGDEATNAEALYAQIAGMVR